jgi:hypothetical protein
MHLIATPSIPRPEDFIDAFDCESMRDEDHMQVCMFDDSFGVRAILTMGAVDRSFSLTIWSGGEESLRIAHDGLGAVAIADDARSVGVRLGGGATALHLTLSVRPRIAVALHGAG